MGTADRGACQHLAAGARVAYPEGGGEQSCAGRFLLFLLGPALRLRLISATLVSTGGTGAGKPWPVKAPLLLLTSCASPLPPFRRNRPAFIAAGAVGRAAFRVISLALGREGRLSGPEATGQGALD